ncbi:MAG: glycerophosphodiester phosphodiesterase [Oscillospiraceae bacterium]|jgi:glycerophosphoryl diester phosphodiesterase|nr:glycerophosphodiester phosphodiesterase [Oscillospiraceae bacterium]
MPLVISHRGANRIAPENTLPAFERAIALGVDGLENDVHMTKDGRLVVCHDDTVDRTSNGRGRICDHTLEELRRLDFGIRFAPEFAGTRLPTLEEFYALCGGLKVIDVEIKRAPDGDTASAAEVIRLAKQAGLEKQLLISSFDPAMLLACAAADADVRTALLYMPASPCCEELYEDIGAFAKKYHLAALHPMVGLVNEAYLEECRSLGLMVNPWTVNLEHALVSLRDWGCDGVITDEPALAARVMYGKSA